MHYVVGDIHGCLDDFLNLINKIDARDPNAEYILVGDIVDRGAKTVEMIDWAMKNIKRNSRFKMVLGNHEHMLIEWHRNFLKSRALARKMGINIYAKYPATMFDFYETLEERELLHEGYIAPVMRFFEKLPLYIKLEVNGVKFLVTHAFAPTPDRLKQIDDGSYITEIDKDDFLWIRVDDKENYMDKDTILIHGHTPTIDSRGEPSATIKYSDNVINVDCGCVFKYDGFNGRLAAICLETLDEFYE